MATEANFNQDDEDEMGQPQSSGGIASQADSGGGSAPAPPRASTPSGTPNIQSYMRANQGAGQQLAQGIGNQFQKKTDQFGQQVKQSGEQIKSQANPLEQKLGSEASNTIKTSFQNPQDILKQQDQLKQFQQLRDKGYQGDINAIGQNAQQSQQQLQSKLGGIQQQAQGAGTEAGRFQLLRNTFGQPQYSQGQQKLDQLFLQAQPGANRQLQQNLGNLTNQAKQQLGGTSAEIQSKLNALSGLSNQNAQQIQDTFKTGQMGQEKLGQGFDDITQGVNQKYAAAQAAAAGVPGLSERFAKNQLSAEDLQSLGLTPDTQVYDLFDKSNPDYKQLSSYVQQNPLAEAGQGGLAQVADSNEFARYNALNQLAGNPQANIFGSSTEAGGGYNPAKLGDQFQTNLQNRSKYYNQELPQNLLNNINQYLGMGQINPLDKGQSLSSYIGLGNNGGGAKLGQALQHLYQNRTNLTDAQAANELKAAYDPKLAAANPYVYSQVQNYLKKYGNVADNVLQPVPPAPKV